MMAFLLLATAVVLLALALVIVPLLRAKAVAGAGDGSLTVLADAMRELEAERAAGDLSDAEYQQARQRKSAGCERQQDRRALHEQGRQRDQREQRAAADDPAVRFDHRGAPSPKPARHRRAA